MHFANTWEVDAYAHRFRDDAILGPAAQTLANLRDWTDTHSDGWAYWPKPIRAADRLITLLEVAVKLEREKNYGHGITWESVRAAYVPVRAFKTRHGADFEICDRAPMS